MCLRGNSPLSSPFLWKVIKHSSFAIFVQCLFVGMLLAESGKSQDLSGIKVSFELKDGSLIEAFKNIERQTAIKFVYNHEQVKRYKNIQYSIKDQDMYEVMETLLKETDLTYQHINNNIIILPVKEQLGSQVGPIRGRVTDKETGEPIPGVNSLIRGSNIGTVTDTDGNYSIYVPDEDAILVFSFVGFSSQEVIVGNKSVIDVALSTDSQNLDEIVVIGYGTQKRSDITGSVASVPQERLEMVPNLNLAQAIQGAVPGVMVQQTQAGAASNEAIMVRGRNSILASNEPLFVVDGIPYYGNIRDINVNDVESIDILKDASSAAIYGSRGANGVILITTKSGKVGKPKIAYEGKFSMQDFINVPDFMDGQEFYEFKETREPGVITSSEQEIYEAGEWTDWQDLALRKGFSQQHNLSVTGGTENTQYFIGGSYLQVQGLAITDDYERITGRVNLDTKITDWLTFGTRTQLVYDDMSGYGLDWNNVFRKNPLTTPYDENGDLTIYPWPEFTDIGNPLEPKNYDDSNESYQVITNNFLLVDVPFVPGLSYRLNTGLRKKLTDISTYIGRNTKDGLEARGIANTDRALNSNLVIENILSYKRQLGRHSLFGTAVYSYEKNKTSSNALTASGFPNDFLTYYSSSQADLVTPEYTYIQTNLNSQMLRINYEYDGRYLITLTGRRDGYSGFGENSKWGIFPSVAVGWNISQEQFFPAKGVIDEMKIRFSIGKNGNQAVGAYESISRMRGANMVALGTTLPGYVPSKLGEENLGWESTRTVNMGMDYSLLNGRIQGDFNYYKSNTYDLVLNRTISLVHGINSITQNIGETENKGFEISLNSRNMVRGDFLWSTSGNITFLKNRIVALYGEKDEDGNEIDDIANAWFIGKPILINYDYKFDGVWQLNEKEAAAEWGSEPGFAKLEDVNKDGAIDAEDRQIIGQQDPKYIWGLSNTFTYKNLSLNIFMHGVHGVTKENELMQDASASSEVRRNVMKKDWWTPENPTNEFYKNALLAQTMGGGSATIYENASFVRIKDISLSYDFPKRIFTKARIEKARVYLTGRNLFTFTEWTGSDPELAFGRGATPMHKEYVFGINLEF